MPLTEILDQVELIVPVPYKLIIHSGERVPQEIAKLDTLISQGRMSALNGWVFSNLQCRWQGLLGRELRKSQFSVFRFNESPNIFQGEVIDVVASLNINDLLSFAKDFKLNQDLIEFETAARQTRIAMSDIERDTWDQLQGIVTLQVTKNKGKK